MLDILPTDFFNTSSVAIDLETTAFYGKLPDPHRDRVLLVGLSNREQHLILEPGEWLEKLWSWMVGPKHLIIGHNLKFDLKFLWKLGCPAQRPYLWDTLICERILTAGRFLECDLGATARRRAGIFMEKGLGKSFRNHLGEFSAEQLYYAREDISHLHTIMEAQRKEFDSWGLKLRDIIKVENQLVPILAETELKGINLNVPAWENAVADELIKAQGYKIAVMEMLGIAPSFNLFKEPQYSLNLNSYDQLLPALQKIGIPVESTGESILAEYQAEYPILQQLLEYRSCMKKVGYNYPKYINPTTGKIHADFRQCGTISGRLSCKTPNLQNVVGEKKYRDIWQAGEGNVLITADYAQQEIRILAQLCRDINLQQACKTSDVYLEVAQTLFEMPDLYKGQKVKIGNNLVDGRYIAKQTTLAIAYGATPATLAIRFGIPTSTGKIIIKFIHSRFPKIRPWAEAQIKKAQQQGYVETLSGKRRWFSGLDDPKKFKKVKNMIRNSPVQGTGSCMLKSAIVLADKKLRNKEVWLTLTVHDEIVFQARKEDAKGVVKILVESMLAAGKKYVDIPMPVDVPTEFSRSWVKP